MKSSSDFTRPPIKTRSPGDLTGYRTPPPSRESSSNFNSGEGGTGEVRVQLVPTGDDRYPIRVVTSERSLNPVNPHQSPEEGVGENPAHNEVMQQQGAEGLSGDVSFLLVTSLRKSADGFAVENVQSAIFESRAVSLDDDFFISKVDRLKQVLGLIGEKMGQLQKSNDSLTTKIAENIEVTSRIEQTTNDDSSSSGSTRLPEWMCRSQSDIETVEKPSIAAVLVFIGSGYFIGIVCGGLYASLFCYQKKLTGADPHTNVKRALVQGLQITFQLGYCYTVVLAIANLGLNIVLQKPLFQKFGFLQNPLIERGLEAVTGRALSAPFLGKAASSLLFVGYPAYIMIGFLKKTVHLNLKNTNFGEIGVFYIVVVVSTAASRAFFLQPDNSSNIEEFKNTFKGQVVLGVLYPYLIVRKVGSAIIGILPKNNS